MFTWNDERVRLLAAYAGEMAQTALANVVREYPHYESYWHTDDDPVPTPRRLHPCFYGSFDWHSCVEMFWVLVRLLRHHTDLVPATEIRDVLNTHLTGPALTAEASFFTPEHQRTTQRPYGWSALLELALETTTWDDPDAQHWSVALHNLGTVFVSRYRAWLPHATYPIRYGIHENDAFGLARALPYASHLAAQGHPQLRQVITETAWRWFGSDRDYPAAWEPSGVDFLSPALAEAELMSRLMPATEFSDWLHAFLPDLDNQTPMTLFTPATVTDPSDGLTAHLHGLNLHRAWCWHQIAHALPAGDSRTAVMTDTAQDHTHSSLPHITAGPYAVEHFLTYYALLLLS